MQASRYTSMCSFFLFFLTRKTQASDVAYVPLVYSIKQKRNPQQQIESRTGKSMTYHSKQNIDGMNFNAGLAMITFFDSTIIRQISSNTGIFIICFLSIGFLLLISPTYTDNQPHICRCLYKNHFQIVLCD